MGYDDWDDDYDDWDAYAYMNKLGIYEEEEKEEDPEDHDDLFYSSPSSYKSSGYSSRSNSYNYRKPAETNNQDKPSDQIYTGIGFGVMAAIVGYLGYGLREMKIGGIFAVMAVIFGIMGLYQLMKGIARLVNGE